jgi:hypothetical protein
VQRFGQLKSIPILGARRSCAPRGASSSDNVDLLAGAAGTTDVGAE